jgi:hypothetical protein
MGLTNQDPGCCCGGSGCNATITVTGCNSAPLAGATVSIAGVGTNTTNSGGSAGFTLPSPGTYSVTASFTGLTTVTVSHTFACPNGGLTIAMTTTEAGFGCCSGGFPMPLPLTLFASACGTMVTLTATTTGQPGQITINNWAGNGTVPGQTVAQFPTDPCTAGTWDGVTTTSGSVTITVQIICSGSTAPPVLALVGVTSTQNETTTFNAGLCDPSTGCCGGVGLANSSCVAPFSALPGTWGPVVSATGTFGSFLPDQTLAGCSASGLTCGGSIEVTS